MISIRARIIRFFSRQVFKRISGDTDIPKLRKALDWITAWARPARGTRISRSVLAGIDCDWLIPEGCDDAPVLFFLHGGAYVTGSSGTHRKMVSHIASAAGMRALLPNYRLAPEHRFPAGLDDCVAVYRALLAGGADPGRVVIAGDSAGGGMAMAVLLSLRDAGDPLPFAACLLSPWLDLAGEGESVVTRAAQDPWFRGEQMTDAVRHYCSDDQVKQPLVSPVYADVTGLPRMLIQVGDHEILLSDSTRLSDKLSAAGISVDLQVWPEMWHVFQFFIGWMPESRRAIRDIGRYLKKQFGVATSDLLTGK
jgi:acetyl esterase/lipase